MKLFYKLILVLFILTFTQQIVKAETYFIDFKFILNQSDAGKKANLQNTKILVSKLQDIKSANKVKKNLAKRFETRKGGYTRIIKAGFRYGDNAPLAIIEFVDRDVKAKRVDRKNKEVKKNQEEKKAVSA